MFTSVRRIFQLQACITLAVALAAGWLSGEAYAQPSYPAPRYLSWKPIHLPLFDNPDQATGCSSLIAAQNVGGEPIKAALASFGAAGQDGWRRTCRRPCPTAIMRPRRQSIPADAGGDKARDHAMDPATAPFDLSPLLKATSALHHHLCPRQVLGVRVGLAGAEALGIDVPQAAKRLLTIVEIDGCFCDGIAVATNCWVGRRTLRIEDFGKTAATFVDTVTEAAVRVCPRPDARHASTEWAPEATNRWQAQLVGYQRLPAEQLLQVQLVRLKVPARVLVSRPGLRVVCSNCGEDVINERQRRAGDRTLCRACAGDAYYTVETPAS